MKATPFAARDVKITDGPFAVAHEKCVSYLLTIDPDRLLNRFRSNAGLKPKGDLYGGWENSGLAGHSLGHYLTACSQEFSSSGDVRFKAKIDYVVAELAACQKNRPDGCLSAIPNGDKVWEEIKRGEIRTGGFDLNGLWSPFYTHHKVLAGLLDANRLVGNKSALTAAEKFADWMIETTKNLSAEQWEKMLNCEYGGMNDALATLYERTKKPKYLELARKFYDHRILDPLAKGENSLPGKHSNTQIPKIIGLAQLYEVDGRPEDRATSRFFWDTVVSHHTYAIGGNSNGEYLGLANRLNDTLTSNTCETCNTYNMLKLTEHLFEWDPQVVYADFYERAWVNHILASQNPADGMMTYFMPLVSGGHRAYSNPFDDWTCCHGSGMENHTKHQRAIYFHDDGRTLYVNQFVPSELKWGPMSIRQTTNFPAGGTVTLDVTGSREFDMAVRHPSWATGAIEVRVNGKLETTSTTPGTYIRLTRKWKTGDRVEFEIPIRLRTEPMPDNPQRIAVLYGPMVLAADLGSADVPVAQLPVLVTGDRPVEEWLGRQAGEELNFRTVGVGRPDELTFRPFYTIHKNRYATYFDQFTAAQWARTQDEYRASEDRRRDLEARTVDAMNIGEMQPERDHKLASERNDVREVNGRGFRTPLRDGWLSFEMKVDTAAANELVLTYWGSERANPEFTISVDGTQLADEDLAGRPLNVFYDVRYGIPAALTSGKRMVTVRIEAKNGKTGPALAGARVVRAKA